MKRQEGTVCGPEPRIDVVQYRIEIGERVNNVMRPGPLEFRAGVANAQVTFLRGERLKLRIRKPNRVSRSGYANRPRPRMDSFVDIRGRVANFRDRRHRIDLQPNGVLVDHERAGP